MYRGSAFGSTKTPGLNMWKHENAKTGGINLWTRKRKNAKTRKRRKRENGENGENPKTRKRRKRRKPENGENPKTAKTRKPENGESRKAVFASSNMLQSIKLAIKDAWRWEQRETRKRENGQKRSRFLVFSFSGFLVSLAASFWPGRVFYVLRDSRGFNGSTPFSDMFSVVHFEAFTAAPIPKSPPASTNLDGNWWEARSGKPMSKSCCDHIWPCTCLVRKETMLIDS